MMSHCSPTFITITQGEREILQGKGERSCTCDEPLLPNIHNNNSRGEGDITREGGEIMYL